MTRGPGFELKSRAGALAALLVVASCGIDQGGYREPVAASNPPPGQTIVVSGPIDGFGSVHVNGLTLDTSRAQIRIDGNPASQADLRVGQMIRAVATADAGVVYASSIDYEENVAGPVAARDDAAGEVTVLGRRIRVTASTRFDGVRLASLADVRVGDRLSVSGIDAPDGVVLATYIARLAAAEPFEITTAITAANATALRFDLGGLTVDYSRAVLLELAGGVPAANVVVEVTGTTLDNGVLVAERVRALPFLPGTFTAASASAPTNQSAAAAPGSASGALAANFIGVISARPTSATLMLGDVEVDIVATTAIVGGAAADLVVGARVHVEGRIVGPASIEATRIRITN
jgi:hypothetical protein